MNANEVNARLAALPNEERTVVEAFAFWLQDDVPGMGRVRAIEVLASVCRLVVREKRQSRRQKGPKRFR